MSGVRRSFDERTSEPRTSVRPERGGAYLLTWTTYGTWLPGHHAGFVSRTPTGFGHEIHNRVETTVDRDDPTLRSAARSRMRGERVVLTTNQARVTASALREVASNHALDMIVFAVMRTHVHIVARTIDSAGQELLRLFKGVSSRRLSQAFGKPSGGRWWTSGGSRRLLTNSESLHGAMRYVLKQARPLEVWRWDSG